MKHATEADAVGVTSFIEIDDFAKVDLRVGQVLSAERIPKADKLLLLKDRSRRRAAATDTRRHRAILRA